MFNLASLPRTLPAALRDVTHRRVHVRLAAVRDLARLAQETPEPAVGALLQALSDPAAPVRARAALALADAQVEVSSSALLPLLDDVDAHVREMALTALGETSRPDDALALEAIRGALESESAALRFQALIAYARVAEEKALPTLLAALGDPDARVRYVALRAAEERIDENAAAPARAELHSRAEAALEDEAADVRLAAAIVLAKTGHAAAFEEIASAVNALGAAREPEDEQTAIDLAGELGIAAARPGLMRRAFGGVLRRDRFAWQARVALARLGDERARRSILKDLHSWSYEVRSLAVAAAGRARVLEARPALLALRSSPKRADPEAVQEALALLA
ncbi:MAG TPA: HEAT repeat domain-containing protein [Polyangiaceae bacterium]|nr:HEAT repeat domain-containing protein [Polyangiaceae bacterium]